MLFRVWSPTPKQVSLQLRDRLVPMWRNDSGWWTVEVFGHEAEIDYAFRIDEGKPLPDPRSPFQPNGVDGMSRTVNHQLFSWTDRNWQARPLSSAVIYEMHVGTFSPEGTFDGAIKHLEHLTRLGISHVELMPVAEFRGDRGWGYDGVNLYAPHHTYGGPAGLKRFVNACHEKGLAVILDVVYNHLGPSGNYLPQFAPYFTEKHTTPWGWGLNFDGPHSNEVRRYFCDNALMWLRDYHVDGLRLDAVHAIIDTSAIPFMEQLATEIDALKAHLGRHLVLIAESDLNDPRVVRPWQMGGFGLDAQWSDDIHHAIHAVLTGERDGYYADFGSVADVATAMEQPYVYAGRHSAFRNRRHGRPPTGLSGSNFLAYLQNHDQLGNRARGERITHLVNHDRAKLGAALVMLSPFIPMIFQGEEWGASAPFQYFVDFHEDPKLAEAVTKGRRDEFAAFGWSPDQVPDPQAMETFNRSRLDWAECDRSPHTELLEWYRQLISLRRKVSMMTDGRLDLVDADFSEDHKWLLVIRAGVRIVANLGDDATAVPLRAVAAPILLLASCPDVTVRDDTVYLPPLSLAVFDTSAY